MSDLKINVVIGSKTYCEGYSEDSYSYGDESSTLEEHGERKMRGVGGKKVLQRTKTVV